MSRWTLNEKLIRMGGAGCGIGAGTARSRVRRGACSVATAIDGSVVVLAMVLAHRPASSVKR